MVHLIEKQEVMTKKDMREKYTDYGIYFIQIKENAGYSALNLVQPVYLLDLPEDTKEVNSSTDPYLSGHPIIGLAYGNEVREYWCEHMT